MGNVNCLRCRFRHEDNGNCTAVGGFCTAVTAAHCPLLCQYLDTGLEPEEVERSKLEIEAGCVKAIARTYRIDINRIRDLARADKDGRLVMLPCKVGDTVYWVHGAVITECKVHRIQKNRNGLYICLKSKKSHGAFRTDLCFGKSIFLTREEAEEALKAMKNGNS